MYDLINATMNDKKILFDFKLDTILKDAGNLNEDELLKIKNYIRNTIDKEIDNYKIIKSDEKVIGCFLLTKLEDGFLLDEIYLIPSYRNKGIGSNIIKETIVIGKPIYLWVYKNNKDAIRLYEKLGFVIINEDKNRFYMKYERLL